MDNIPPKGVWSGRGIAIPVAGAIGGGDDYKQKIGRGKLPDFRSGRPLQGADSTYSSYLARVNTGYEDFEKYIEDMPMFPEQEEEDEDIYLHDYLGTIGHTRKLPKNLKIMRPRLEEKYRFNEDDVIMKSAYSLENALSDNLAEAPEEVPLSGLGDLSDIFDDNISRMEEEGLEFPNFTVGGLAWEALKDGFASVMDVATFETYGVIQLIPGILTNLGQLRSANKSAEKLLESFLQNPADNTGHQLNEISQNITRDIIDLIQVILRALPASAVGESLSFAMAQVAQFGASAAMRGAAETFKNLWDILPEVVQFIFNILPVFGTLFDAINTMGKIHEALAAYQSGEISPMSKSTQPPTGARGLTGIPADMAADIELKKPISKRELYSALLGLDESQTIREFISEASRIESSESFHTDQPVGYMSWDVPKSKELEDLDSEGELETLDSYDDFEVIFKTDSGNVAYQPVSLEESLEEKALRRIIRRNLSSISETKKKRY